MVIHVSCFGMISDLKDYVSMKKSEGNSFHSYFIELSIFSLTVF